MRATMAVVEIPPFEQVADAVRGLEPGPLGAVRCRAQRYGIKVWFGADTPPREHYEAQVIGADHSEVAKALVIEVGFHSEHPSVVDNDAVLATLLAAENRWRPALGGEPVAGPFLGRANDWRRISETWDDPDLSDGELVFELAARLADYLTALKPVRRAGVAPQ
jgi:hypothetical protein